MTERLNSDFDPNTDIDKSKGWPVDVWLPSPLRLTVPIDNGWGIGAEADAEEKIITALRGIGIDIDSGGIVVVAEAPVEVAISQGWIALHDEDGRFSGIRRPNAHGE